MGQCYSICADLKPKKGNARKAVAKYNAIVKTMVDSGVADFGDGRKPVRSVVGIQKELFAESQEDFRIENGTCYSCFHGSYGWEAVMESAFNVLAPFLVDESSLEMNMDEGCRTLVVSNGAVSERWESNEPDEDNDNE